MKNAARLPICAFTLGVFGALAACGGSDVTDDQNDASAPQDASVGPDAARDATGVDAPVSDARVVDTGTDAGSLADAAADVLTDAGSKADADATIAPDADAGTSPDADAGTSPDADAGVPVDEDAGVDAGPTACADLMYAVVGGDTSGQYFNAIEQGGVGWRVSGRGDEPVTSTPSVIGFGSTFVEAHRGDPNALRSNVYTGGAWGAPSRIGTAATASAPSLALYLGVPNVLYSGLDTKYYRGVFAAGAWDAANDPVGGATPATGSSAPAAAGRGTELFVLHNGGATTPQFVREERLAGTWSTMPASGTVEAEPAIAPTLIDSVAGSFLVAAFVRKADHAIMVTKRNVVAANGALEWSVPNALNATAKTDTQVSIARYSDGFVLVYRGLDMRLYYSTADVNLTSWSAPVAVTADTTETLSTAPQATRGICDDLVAVVYAQASGQVRMVRLQGSPAAWTAPEGIGGVQAAYIGVARSDP